MTSRGHYDAASDVGKFFHFVIALYDKYSKYETKIC